MNFSAFIVALEELLGILKTAAPFVEVLAPKTAPAITAVEAGGAAALRLAPEISTAVAQPTVDNVASAAQTAIIDVAQAADSLKA
jgi:hypothetical protein